MQRLAIACALPVAVLLTACQALPTERGPQTVAPDSGDQNLRRTRPAVSLLAAADRGDIVTVRLALAQGRDVDAVDENGMSPLMLATQGGHDDIAAHLLNRGAQTWTRNRKGRTALHLASRAGHTAIVERLLASGARINARTHSGDTALLLAALHDHTAVVKTLLDHRALVNLRDINGISPLMLASDNGNLDIVRMLVNRGADVNASTADGESALALARDKGFREIIDLLKRAGATEPYGYRQAVGVAGAGNRDRFDTPYRGKSL